jgi:hypothetical protein
MAVAALVISLLALLFTLGSFWWLNARRGSIQVATPQSYAFVHGFRLRLPLAFFNSGAVPLLITDLRICICGVGHFPWQTTRSTLRPSSDDEHAFGTPFSIRGRDTKELIAEFGENHQWLPEPGADYRICLEAKVHPEKSWDEVLAFTWWAPPRGELMARYIAHRNQPEAQDSGAEN